MSEHDDVCRGAADGCDCDTALCEGCGRQVRKDELEPDPVAKQLSGRVLLRCEECRGEFEDEA